MGWAQRTLDRNAASFVTANEAMPRTECQIKHSFTTPRMYYQSKHLCSLLNV